MVMAMGDGRWERRSVPFHERTFCVNAHFRWHARTLDTKLLKTTATVLTYLCI